MNDRAAADNSTLTRDLHCICHPPGCPAHKPKLRQPLNPEQNICLGFFCGKIVSFFRLVALCVWLFGYTAIIAWEAIRFFYRKGIFYRKGRGVFGRSYSRKLVTA